MDNESQEAPRRSIQDIIPPARSKPLRTPPVISQTPLPPPPPQGEPLTMTSDGNNKRYFFLIVAVGALLLIGAGVAVASTVFHRAYVTVTPHVYEVELSDTFQSTPDDATLPYSKVSVDDTVTKNVTASGSKQVQDRAMGTLTVYNAFSTGPQRLITNTRFQSKDGLIYRVHSPVVVPGYTMKAGVKVPGSIDITVHADEPGEKYNSTGGDYTLPGLKDSEQARLIYAKSKTALSGGFVGARATVDATLRRETVDALKADLDRSLRTKLSEATPPGAVIFSDTVNIVYAEAPDRVEGSDAVISVTGTASAPSFMLENLASKIAEAHGIQFGGVLTLSDPQSMGVQLDSPSKASNGEPVQLSASGPVRLVALFDESALIQSLSGKSEDDLGEVRANTPAIERMQFKIYPFWRGSIPSDVSKIKLETVLGEETLTP